MEFWNYFSGNLDLRKGCLISEWLYSVCSPGTPRSWPGEVSSRVTTGSNKNQALSAHWTPPRPTGIWCWIPQLPQRNFCLWMDAKVLLVRAGQKWVLCLAGFVLTSPSPVLLMSLYSSAEFCTDRFFVLVPCMYFEDINTKNVKSKQCNIFSIFTEKQNGNHHDGSGEVRRWRRSC